MRLKTGKEEITYLLSKVMDRYEQKTGEHIIRNTNRKNYERIAQLLSEISGQLPGTADSLGHDFYTADEQEGDLEYPFRKYDITSSQVKDASLGIVNNPRNFLVDACYIYLFGVGRKGFEQHPLDEHLLEKQFAETSIEAQSLPATKTADLQPTTIALDKQGVPKGQVKAVRKRSKAEAYLLVIIGGLLVLLMIVTFAFYRQKAYWTTIRSDMSIIPYQPTQMEIDSLEGIWVSYTASPQARSSNPDRYHLVVCNVIDVHYKEGYFTFSRYGASFDHVGYMQYESPWIVSVHSFVRNNKDSIESPRHSLLRLDQNERMIPVISASWNFDVGKKNNIIGNREVYIKQGKGGKVTEVLNTLENANCHCKIVEWQKPDGEKRTFYLKNELLDKLPNDTLRHLLDETSILPRQRNMGLLIQADSLHP